MSRRASERTIAKNRRLSAASTDSRMELDDPNSSQMPRPHTSRLLNFEHLSSEEGREVSLIEQSFRPEHRLWLQTFQQYTEEERNRLVVGLLYRCRPEQLRTLDSHMRVLMKRDFISLLPEELALYLMSFLDAKSLCACALVSRAWRRYAEDNTLWKNLWEGHMQDSFEGVTTRPPTGIVLGKITWKRQFLKRMRIESNWRNGRCSTKVLNGHDENVITYLHFDEEKIVSGSDDCTLKIWDLKTGKCLHTLEGHRGGVWSCHVEGNIIVSGSTDRTVKIWDGRTGQCVRTLEGHLSTVRCLHLVGGRLVSGSRDMTLRVWDMEAGTSLHILRGHTAAVRCVQFDGRRIVSGSYDHNLKVWDAETGACLHTLAGHTQKIYSMQFDGRIVVSGSLDTTIRVWSVETGACLQVLQGHTSLVGLMQLRGNMLVSGNADKTLKVWNVNTGECLHTMTGHENAVTCVQFDKDWVVSGSMDGTLRLWDIKTGRQIRELLNIGDHGVVWRVQYTDTKIVCAVRASTSNEAKLQILDFDDERYEMTERDRLERQDEAMDSDALTNQNSNPAALAEAAYGN
eukprot:comp21713_c0_seq2/m.30677 comp21713_c0_seq2/g.30677  ORF comp21713_c0_seq2/g.30677 comp21713_c0_seq2/m.30677 type:complete len:571 (-) comp21713_c0_seq2:634-2346(-)